MLRDESTYRSKRDDKQRLAAICFSPRNQKSHTVQRLEPQWLFLPRFIARSMVHFGTITVFFEVEQFDCQPAIGAHDYANSGVLLVHDLEYAST